MRERLARVLLRIGRSLRRKYLSWRYPNLTLEYGVVITGRFRLLGTGAIRVGAGSRLVNVRLRVDGKLDIGRNCYLNGACVVCMQAITIGDDCIISDAYLTDTDFHNVQPELRHAPPGPKTMRPIVIERNVWIGDRGVVLKGSQIGADSVVGSNAVVRGTVAPRSLCMGNPAQVVKTL
jgi:acetyltransferase-like isoleucine patch superfamily enzyme